MRTFKVFWPHILCAVVTLGLWDTPVIKPFRVFVVLVHEMGHAGTALATGGEVQELRVRWDESGHVRSAGGFFPAISSAGYVGASFLGALMIFLTSWPGIQRVFLGIIGACTIIMTSLYTPSVTLDFAFGWLSGLILLIVALKYGQVSRWLGNWLGVVLCLYSLYEFKTDLWMFPERTDAGILAQYWEMSILTWPIAICWAGVSLIVMYIAMRSTARRVYRQTVGAPDSIPASDPEQMTFESTTDSDV